MCNLRLAVREGGFSFGTQYRFSTNSVPIQYRTDLEYRFFFCIWPHFFNAELVTFCAVFLLRKVGTMLMVDRHLITGGREWSAQVTGSRTGAQVYAGVRRCTQVCVCVAYICASNHWIFFFAEKSILTRMLFF